MHAPNPWKSYRQIATQTAPPGQLVLMLYDGAIRFLHRSLDGFSVADTGESLMAIHNNLHRAQEIIRELNCALNMEQGGDFAETLRRLYDYFDRRLSEANIRKEKAGIEEVIQHLGGLREAWAAMLSGQQIAPDIAPAALPALAAV